MTTFLEKHKIEHIQLGITTTPIQTVSGAPLVLSNNQISFSYDLTDFQLDGDSIQIKDSGIDHGSLSGLSDDDHSIYALLAGRSGGQILKGGTDSGDDLTFQSTSHVTKGSILFGTSAYDEVNNRLGIGTTTIPHGSVGAAKFVIDGTNVSISGPHIQITTDTDDYPIFQQLNWSHDNINFAFDAFYDGAWKSSDLGSNFLFAKNSDTLAWKYDSSVAQGGVVSWNNGIVMDSSGNVGIGTTPSYRLDVKDDVALSYVANFFNDGNNANRYGIRIQCGADDQSSDIHYYLSAFDGDGNAEGYLQVNAGTLEIVQASTEKRKTDIKDTDINALSILNNIPVRSFRRRRKEIHEEKLTPLHRVGFIAEELKEVFPEAVSEDLNGDLFISESRLISLLVKGIQEQQKQIQELKSQISRTARTASRLDILR